MRLPPALAMVLVLAAAALPVDLAAAQAMLGSSASPASAEPTWLVGSVWYLHDGAPDVQPCATTWDSWTPGEASVVLAPSTPGAWRATIVWFSHVSFCKITRTCEGSGDLATDIVGSCPGLPAAEGTFYVTWLSEDRWFFVQETRGADGSTDRMDGVVQPGLG